MGRPLNKKYFGNRNIGSASTTADNGIGGQGLATISVATAGSFVVNNTYQNFPRLTITAPQLPTGVQATADVVFEIDTVTYTAGGQTNADYVAGLSTSITGLGGGAIINITEVASKVTAVDVTTAGTNRGEFRRGDFTGSGLSSHQVLQAPNAGTDLQVTFTFRVKSITVVEQGSGYTAVPTLAWDGHTFTGQTTPSGNTPALTTDSGSAGTVTNDENAIIIRANVNDNGNKVGDIIKQVSTHRYKVRTADGTGIVELIEGDTTPNVGKAMIIATDVNGSTYYVTKLTSRKAVVYQKSMVGSYDFTNGQSVKWTFGSAVAPTTGEIGVVTIENA
jgi:hypothetical protein